MRRLIAIVALGVFLGGAGASAGSFDSGDVVNGDFENGSTGWTLMPPTANWIVDVQPTGGNPNGTAYMQSPFFEDPGSTACIEQEIVCGSTAGGTGCAFSLDYYLQTFDAAVFSGRLQVYLDDELLFETPAADVIDWTTLGFSTDCGVHTLRLCLDVDPGNNAWIGRFDNVSAECMMPLPTEPSSWGRVKAVYR